MNPKARVKKLEETQSKAEPEPVTIAVNWDEPTQPEPGRIVINWPDSKPDNTGRRGLRWHEGEE